SSSLGPHAVKTSKRIRAGYSFFTNSIYFSANIGILAARLKKVCESKPVATPATDDPYELTVEFPVFFNILKMEGLCPTVVATALRGTHARSRLSELMVNGS